MKSTTRATSRKRTPRYHGRDVAIVRAQAAGACVVLGSATPSLESRFNAQPGKYTLLEIPDRIAERPMPTVQVIDMRQEFLETRKHAIFSRALHRGDSRAAGEQRTGDDPAEPARIFHVRGLPFLR